MRDTLKPGIEHELKFRVPETKTVPHLYPEAPEFQAMPRVFATGYLVGFLEWACIQAVNPHLEWPREQTVGTHVDVSHAAATPPGLEIVARGTHERFVIDAARFTDKAHRKSLADRAK